MYLGEVERYREYTPSGTVQLERWTLLVEGMAQLDTLTVENSSAVAVTVPVVRYQYRDHLGSSTVEANELGQVISYEEYYPYGSSAYRASSSSQELSLKRYRFTGKERDEETGLDYFGVRYYASWLGRWTSGDPGGFVDGLNLYRYVRNNPVNGVDELGYETDPPKKNVVDATNALGDAAEEVVVTGESMNTTQAAFSIGRRAGISTQDIIAKLGNATLRRAFESDRAGNRWIFEQGTKRFNTGLQSETAQDIEKIAFVMITPPLLLGGASAMIPSGGAISISGSTLGREAVDMTVDYAWESTVGTPSPFIFGFSDLLEGIFRRGAKSATLGIGSNLGKSGSTITDPLVLKSIAKERNGAVGLFLDPSNGGSAFRHISSKKVVDNDYFTLSIHGLPGRFGIAKEPFGYGFWRDKKDLVEYGVSDDALFGFIKNHSGWDGKKPIHLQSCFGGCSQLFQRQKHPKPGYFYGEHFASNAQRMADALGVNVKAPMHKINVVENGFFRTKSFVGPSKFLPNYTFSYQIFKPRI